MDVGIVGCGALGLPVGIALAEKFTVRAYDVLPEKMRKRKYERIENGPNGEDDFQERFDRSTLEFRDLKTVCEQSSIIFVAVATPHQPRFDGSVRLPVDRADFDYRFLETACQQIAEYVRPEQTVAVISTVLPGTMRRVVKPILGDKCKVLHNPYFIAMGTVLKDYKYPEMVLIGQGREGDALDLCALYSEFYGTDSSAPPFMVMSWESAELTKVSYNTIVTTKTVIGNNIQEIAHKTPHANCDHVVAALSVATDRICSPKYLRGQMGDGGQCHPRDNIAMSWLARKLNLSCNIYEDIMLAREKQAEWIANLFCQESRGLPKIILGRAFKEETNIVAGSAAILVANILRERGVSYAHHDPYIDGRYLFAGGVPKAFLIATKHECFKTWDFPAGSVVLDPFRFLPHRDDITIIPVGIGV